MPTWNPPTKRALIAAAAIVVVPALLLVDVGIAAARGWAFESRVDAVACLAASALLASAVFALAVHPLRGLLANCWAQCILLTTAISFSLVLVEAALALVSANLVEPPYHRRWPDIEMTFDPDPTVMPGVSGHKRFVTNSLGIRGPEFPPRDAAYRILCLGGSTTECAYLNQDETWPGLVMQQINHAHTTQPVWVGNAGISGFSSTHHVRFAEESELMDEIDCLVVLVGVNDLGRILEAGELEVDRLRLEARYECIRPFWSYSALRGLSRQLVNRYAMGITTHAEDSQGHNYTLRRAERAAAPKQAPLPDLTAALDEYDRRIARIIAACRRRNVRPVFLSQPTLWSSDLAPPVESLLWLGWSQSGDYLPADRLRQGIDRYNETLAAACRRHNVEFVDLSDLEGDTEFFYDDCHFTEAGARAVARRVSDSLMACPPLDDQPAQRILSAAE